MQQRARLFSFMASRYTEMMMPTMKFMAKVTTLRIPVQMPPVRAVASSCALGRMVSVRVFRALL